MLVVLRNRNFSLLWLGGLVSQLGDWALAIALPMYVYRLTGSTLATSGAFLAELVPSLLLGAVAGVFVDRWDRRRIVIVANVGLALGLLPLLAVRSPGLIWLVYLVAFGQAVIGQFLFPAWNALLPSVVAPDELVSANSLRSLAVSAARLLGPVVGGLAAVAGSLGAAALLDSCSFLTVAVMALLVSGVASTPQGRHVGEGAAVRGFARQLLEGLAVVRGSRVVATLVASNTIVSLGEGVFSVMFVVWVRQVLNGGTLQYGWFMSAQAVGGILGALAVAHLGRRLPPGPVLGLCTVAFGLMDMVLFSYPLVLHGVAIGLAIIILVGFPGAATGATWNALLQLSLDDARRGRIFGLIAALSSGATLLGTIIAGALGGIVGPIVLLNAMQGGLYVAAGAIVLIALRHTWAPIRDHVTAGRLGAP